MKKLDSGERVENEYANCDPLGNLLAIQNGNMNAMANDNEKGAVLEL